MYEKHEVFRVFAPSVQDAAVVLLGDSLGNEVHSKMAQLCLTIMNKALDKLGALPADMDFGTFMSENPFLGMVVLGLGWGLANGLTHKMISAEEKSRCVVALNNVIDDARDAVRSKSPFDLRRVKPAVNEIVQYARQKASQDGWFSKSQPEYLVYLLYIAYLLLPSARQDEFNQAMRDALSVARSGDPKELPQAVKKISALLNASFGICFGYDDGALVPSVMAGAGAASGDSATLDSRSVLSRGRSHGEVLDCADTVSPTNKVTHTFLTIMNGSLENREVLDPSSKL